ncbi:MBL fold metallo-hydrolase [Anditalea andensis]|uniref:Metallo-beta-lactamase domain-containing protein n=1 Tax=Anditalea andensis TaxID=1048983 RepID=A0A074L6V0_9BACT|nr:MBL fold metallo-hydrolase [Anditalea andensis]KEO75548.1 hypothetical protein EL17_00190 [Anditalea andensis]
MDVLKKSNWRKISLYGASLLILTGGAFYVVAFHILSGPGYKGPVSDHFDGDEFYNLEPTKKNGIGDVLEWQFNKDPGEWPDRTLPSKNTVPLESIDGERVTFINHASLLIQIQGINLLTDPIWSYRASPFSFAGPARKREAGIRFEDLPHIHAVLISHNHYDHLDLSTLKKLHEVYDPIFIVPLGVDLLLKQHNIHNIHALDWFDQLDISNTHIHAVPAKHFSGRGMGDTNKTLWSGYLIESGQRKIYFAGDTGYGDFYKSLHARYGPIDLALLPIGAYKPIWFMQPIHMSPEEAVQAHLDLGASKSIGMHFGTFPMADDGLSDPLIDLSAALARKNVDPKKFFTLREGECFDLNIEKKGFF